MDFIGVGAGARVGAGASPSNAAPAPPNRVGSSGSGSGSASMVQCYFSDDQILLDPLDPLCKLLSPFLPLSLNQLSLF